MKIRLIDSTEYASMSGAEQMALDEAIFRGYEAAQEPEFPITLRFYTFTPPCVTFGYFQKVSTLNNGFINGSNFQIARRITGGRAVLHHKDLTYSVIFHKSSGFHSDSILENYKYVADSLLSGLARVAIKGELHPSVKKDIAEASKAGGAICFDSPSFLEIKVDGKKFCGSAQNKTNNCFLQHGTIYFELDPKVHYLAMTAPEALKYMDEEMIEEQAGKLKNSVCSIDAIAGLESRPDFKTLAGALREGFAENLKAEVVSASLSAAELAGYNELKNTKYMAPKWNSMR